jgi:hypothetical protein
MRHVLLEFTAVPPSLPFRSEVTHDAQKRGFWIFYTGLSE